MTPDQPPKTIKIAVVTGYHWYYVQEFNQLFRKMPQVDAYVQHMLDFCASPKAERDSYDVIVFFMMHNEPSEKEKEILENIVQNGQGIVILHHSMFAYCEWDWWRQLGSLPQYTRQDVASAIVNQELTIYPTPVKHPITMGMKPWKMTTEIFTFDDITEQDGEILLTTDHPVSMKTLAWTKQFQHNKVFCFSLGHDIQTWADENFQKILYRGILWCGKTL